MDTSQTDRKVYQVVRQAVLKGASLPLDANLIAAKAGTSRSTVYRSVKRLGYRNLGDMASRLRGYYESIEHKRVGNSLNNQLALVASLLDENKDLTILVDGLGDGEACCDYIIQRLNEHGFYAVQFTPQIAQSHSRANSSGLAFIVNESGVALWGSCLECRAYGFYTIALTSVPDSPVYCAADLGIVLENDKSQPESYRPNYYAAGVIAFFERALEQYLIAKKKQQAKPMEN